MINKKMALKLVKLIKSPRAAKKLRAIFQHEDGRQVTRDFGSAGMDDYILTHDKDQRARYRSRHAKDLLGDPTKPGYLSYYILWGESTSIIANVAAYKRKFRL